MRSRPPAEPLMQKRLSERRHSHLGLLEAPGAHPIHFRVPGSFKHSPWPVWVSRKLLVLPREDPQCQGMPRPLQFCPQTGSQWDVGDDLPLPSLHFVGPPPPSHLPGQQEQLEGLCVEQCSAPLAPGGRVGWGEVLGPPGAPNPLVPAHWVICPELWCGGSHSAPLGLAPESLGGRKSH